MQELQNLLNIYNHHYYVMAEPMVSDDVFDSLMAELRDLELKHPEHKVKSSVTERVGTGNSTLEKVKHKKAMLSLSNIFNETQLRAWVAEIIKVNPEVVFELELKYDGLALSLHYENGELVRGVTRGNGEEGDDVTANCKMICNIPNQLTTSNPPAYVEVRGECVVPRSGFNALNERLSAKGLKTYSNPRNAAAGLIRTLDSASLKDKPLAFYPYDSYGLSSATVDDAITVLGGYGFDISNRRAIVTTADQIMDFYNQVMDNRDKLPIDIDGVVIKVNSVDDQTELGMTSREPKWATAFKFPPVERVTTLLGITWQVGRSGIVTPVANVAPVEVGGVIVRNVSLYNPTEITRLGLVKGIDVVICRRGDVIPKIIGVVDLFDREKPRKFHIPDKCPCCDRTIYASDSGILRCYNVDGCNAQTLSKFRHFMSDEGMRIMGYGGFFIQEMLDNEIFKTVADIYRVADFKDKIVGEGFTEKRFADLLAKVEASKNVQLCRFINALSIPDVGLSTAKELESRFITFEAFMEATLEDLLTCESIGEVVAGNILKFIKDKDNIEVINDLLSSGVKPMPKKDKVTEGKLAGQIWCLTGQFFKFTKGEAATMIEDNAGTVVTNPNKTTTHALVGNGAGFKYGKAVKYKCTILKEKDFIKLMGL